MLFQLKFRHSCPVHHSVTCNFDCLMCKYHSSIRYLNPTKLLVGSPSSHSDYSNLFEGDHSMIDPKFFSVLSIDIESGPWSALLESFVPMQHSPALLTAMCKR